MPKAVAVPSDPHLSLLERLERARALNLDLSPLRGELVLQMRELPHEPLLELVRRADCPRWFLQAAAAHPYDFVRVYVAAHPHSDGDWLVRLASDPVELVRETAALHPRLPESVLDVLAGESSRGVRLHVAMNEQTPASLLERLALDEDHGVRSVVARNRSTPAAVLERLAADQHKSVLFEVAGNAKAPVDQLEKLAGSPIYKVREQVGYNPRCPRRVLERLANDAHPYVSCSAREVLAARDAALHSALRGGELWWELRDRFGQPSSVEEWPEETVREAQRRGEILWVSVKSDGYGSGDVSFSLETGQYGLSFGVPLQADWAERLHSWEWDRMADLGLGW